MTAPETIDLTLILHQDASIALLVGKTQDIDAAVWLRKREIAGYEPAGCGQVFVIVDRALAAERGLA